jgi:hypothetical protein
MNNKVYLFVIIVIALALSCKKEGPIDTPETSDYIFPLSVGNRWEYVAWSKYTPQSVLTREVLEQVNVNSTDGSSKAYSVFSGDSSNISLGILWLFWNAPNGLYAKGGISFTDSMFINTLELKYPAIKGESWQVLDFRYSYANELFYVKDTLTYSVVADNDTILTPAGLFAGCYVYNHQVRQASDVSGFDDYYDYYLPKVGLVGTIIRTVVRGQVKDTTYKLLLSSFSVR